MAAVGLRVLVLAVAAALIGATVACAASLFPITVAAEEDVVRLQWETPSDTLYEGFAVERQLAGSSGWTQLTRVRGEERRYDDRLAPSTEVRQYRYRVVAAGAGGPAGEPVQVAVPAAGSTPRPTPSVTPTRTPIPTATPIPLPSVIGGQQFQEEVYAALRLLYQSDDRAYTRYVRNAKTLREDTRPNEDFCAFARPLLGEILVYANCITRLPAGPERTRRLATVISHEATHLAFQAEGTRGLVVQFDSQWLAAAVADITARYQAIQRRRNLAELAPEQQRAYAVCDKVISDTEDLIARNPNAQQAAKNRARAEALAQNATCRGRVDAEVDRLLARYGAETDAEVRRALNRDWVADYLANLQTELGVTFTSEVRKSVIASECWAQHEGLVTYSKLGGVQVGELDDVLFLNHTECRQVLNLH
jgi:hypothetical protein